MQSQLRRHNVWLHKDDMTWLRETYPNLSAAMVIRTLIQRHRRDLEGKHPIKHPHPDILTMTESRP